MWPRSSQQRIILQNDVKGSLREQLIQKSHLQRGNDRLFHIMIYVGFMVLFQKRERVFFYTGTRGRSTFWSSSFKLLFRVKGTSGRSLENEWSFPWERVVVPLLDLHSSTCGSRLRNEWSFPRERRSTFWPCAIENGRLFSS